MVGGTNGREPREKVTGILTNKPTETRYQTDKNTETGVANRNVEGEQRVTRRGRSPARGVTGHFRGSGAREYVEDPTKLIGWACVEWKCGTK